MKKKLATLLRQWANQLSPQASQATPGLQIKSQDLTMFKVDITEPHRQGRPATDGYMITRLVDSVTRELAYGDTLREYVEITCNERETRAVMRFYMKCK